MVLQLPSHRLNVRTKHTDRSMLNQLCNYNNFLCSVHVRNGEVGVRTSEGVREYSSGRVETYCITVFHQGHVWEAGQADEGSAKET